MRSVTCSGEASGPSSAFIRMTSDGSNSRTTTISAAASRDISPGTTVQTLQDKRRHFGRGAACPKPRPNVALGPVNIEMACTLFERPPSCCRLSAAHSAGDGRSARRRWQDSPRPVRVLIATRHATSSVVGPATEPARCSRALATCLAARLASQRPPALSEKYKTHQGEGGHRSMTRNTIATGKTDAMTAGGQMTERGHNEELPPVTFRIDIPVMAVRVSGSNPSRTGAWRHFPPTRLPSVGVAITAVISPNPDVISAWTKGAMLPNANRRPKPDNDLRMSRYQPQGKPKQHGKSQFSYFLLRWLYKQVYGRSGEAVSTHCSR